MNSEKSYLMNRKVKSVAKYFEKEKVIDKEWKGHLENQFTV